MSDSRTMLPFEEFISTDTKHTTRNLLIAASVTLFAVVCELPLHKLPLVGAALGEGNPDTVVAWGLAVLLIFLMVSHALNWYGDWLGFAEWRAIMYQPEINQIATRQIEIATQVDADTKKLAAIRSVPDDQDKPSDEKLPGRIARNKQMLDDLAKRLLRWRRHEQRGRLLVVYFHAWLPLGLGCLGVLGLAGLWAATKAAAERLVA